MDTILFDFPLFHLKKRSGHDPLNWFRDPLNWFLDPLMCHDQQFEKHWPDPIPALPPSPERGTGKVDMEKSEIRDWDK